MAVLSGGCEKKGVDYISDGEQNKTEIEFLQKLLVIDARDGSVIDLVKLSEMVYGQTIEDLEEMEETQEQEMQKALDQLEE